MRGQIPSGMLDVNAYSFRGCADEYAASMAPMFQLVPMLSDAPLAHNFAAAWQSDRIVLGIGESNPFTRCHDKQEIQNAGHLIEVSRYLYGTERGVSGNHIVNRQAGLIYVLDQERPFHTVNSQFKVQQVFIPKAGLGLPPDDLQKEHVISPTSSCGGMLHACMNDLYADTSQDSARIDLELVERFFALLKINLGVNPQRGDVRTHFREALRDQICEYIEQNLGDPALAAPALLGSFGVSRATLYRMFEDWGGVRSYIMARRAVRAVLDLSGAPLQRGQGRRASDRWGFSTQPNFNRAMRRRFGVSPGRLFTPSASSTRSPNGRSQMFKRFTSMTAQAA